MLLQEKSAQLKLRTGLANESSLQIQGPAGLLETVVAAPTDTNNPEWLAVICHPHPLQGGTMTNKVVTTLAKTLHHLGMAAVRFNFRGVGNSQGQYDGGRGETADLLAIVDHFQRNYPAAKICLAGFSFGAYIAYRGATEVAADDLITVSPPVNHFDFSSLPVPSCPWLVIQGDNDEVVPHTTVLTWLADLSVMPECIIMPGSSHFFHGRLTEMRDHVIAHILQANLLGNT